MSDELALSQSERDAGIVRCDACPVLCRIRPGRAGACDRYANEAGKSSCILKIGVLIDHRPKILVAIGIPRAARDFRNSAPPR